MVIYIFCPKDFFITLPWGKINLNADLATISFSKEYFRANNYAHFVFFLRPERVHDTMEHAFKKKKQQEEDTSQQPGPSGLKWPAAATTTTTTRAKKRNNPPAAKKGLWMGVDLTESDLESSSDEE